jgi:hypothetical protein
MRPIISTVDDFVVAKAPNFNKFQQSSTSGPQSFQPESVIGFKNAFAAQIGPYVLFDRKVSLA